jgi:vancomycin resistance protein VanJ
MKRLLISTLWGYGAGMLAFFMLRKVIGDHFLVIRLINYSLPWAAGALVMALLVAAYFRQKALSVFLLAALLPAAFSFSYLFTNWTGAAAAAESRTTIRVMSFNVWKLNRNFTGIAGVIANEGPDVVLLQEVLPFQMQAIFLELARVSGPEPWNLAYDPAVDQALISRFPIVESEVSRRNNRAQKAFLETPIGRVRVINVHGYRDGWMGRHFGIENIIAEDVLPEQSPLILGGDFNTTDQSETFLTVLRHLNNSHLEAGKWFGFSFPAADTYLGFFGLRLRALTGLVRIDHIFYSRHFRATRAYTLTESGGSDHFPVVAELEFN